MSLHGGGPCQPWVRPWVLAALQRPEVPREGMACEPCRRPADGAAPAAPAVVFCRRRCACWRCGERSRSPESPFFVGFCSTRFFFLVGAIRFIIRGLLEWLYNTVSDYVVLFVFLKVFYSKRSECWSLAFWLFWIIPTKEKGHLYHLKPAARVFYVGNFTTPLGRDAFLRLRRGSFRIMYSLGGLTDYLKIWIITYG